MGVNHGGGDEGDESPQNLQWADANTGCPPRFLSFSKFLALAMDSSPPRFQPRSMPLLLSLFVLIASHVFRLPPSNSGVYRRTRIVKNISDDVKS
jgi:hypothetical protein